MSPVMTWSISHLPWTYLRMIYASQNGHCVPEKTLDDVRLPAKRLFCIESIGGPTQSVQRGRRGDPLVGFSHKALNQSTGVNQGSPQTRALAIVLG